MTASPLARDLASAFPGLRTSADAADRTMYARDLWPRHHMAVRAGRPMAHEPGAIAWPTSTEEVASLVRWAGARGVPVVPFGAGSGVCGGVAPHADTVVMDLKRMGRIRTLDASAPVVEVEAGHMGVPLEMALERAGFTLGHFPSSILCSSAGGWIAARSAGQCSGAYGKIEDMTASLECVTGTGEVVTLRRRTHGPDLVPLVVGSEGTLAVVTAATFRLHPSPASRAFGGFTFGTTEEGWEAMRAMFQAGLRPAVSRLYDPFDAMLARQGGVKSGKQKSGPGPSRGPGMGGVALRAILRSPARVNELLHSSFGAKRMGGAMLVLIFEGAGDAPREQLEQARRIAEGAGGRWDGEAAARRWLEHRYAVSYRQAPIFAEGAFVDTMEVAARWSQLGALYDGVRRALGRHVFVMAHLSHAYPDGCCIYFSFVGRADPGLVRERGWDGACEATYDRTWQGALAAAVDAGGTLSHHHGVGRSKAPRLPAELGAGVGVVRSLMRALDPKGLLNPGNLVPVEGTPVVGAPVAPTIDRGVTVDEASLLASVPAAVTLADADSTLRARGLTLDLHGADMALPLGRWLAEGARGARDPWLDPTDQLLAGFDATLPGGARLAIRPTPRRAVGPDLTALFLGTRDRFGPVDRAWMRVHRVGVPRPTSSSFTWDRDPPVTPGETSLLDAIATSLTPEATPSDGRR